MMTVVGEEGTSIADFVLYLKSEYLDAVYLQQDAYDPVDGASSGERQQYVFDVISDILAADLSFPDKGAARNFFHQLTQTTKDWNRADMNTEEFRTLEKKLREMVERA